MNILNKYNKILPENIRYILEISSKCADDNGFRLFIVGGAVRDLILEQKIIDIDLLIEGNAFEYGQKLTQEYHEICSIKEFHKDFNTLKMIYKIGKEQFEIDIASTRQEIYPEPACLPVLVKTGCSLKEDVLRRDFTINSMAMSLNLQDFGEVIDYVDGLKDLNDKKLRILHDKSFVDDPTRIVRALKFRVRFGFDLEVKTKKLQNDCIASGMFDNIGSERMKSELKQTFGMNSEVALYIYIYEKIYTFVEKDIEVEKLCPASEIRQAINNYFDLINPNNIWLIYICSFLIFSKNPDNIKRACKKLNLTAYETEIILGLKDILDKIEFLKNANKNSEIYEFLANYSIETIVALFAISDENLKKKIHIYIRELKDTEIFTTGRDLINVGIIPGPAFGDILKQLLFAKLNGKFCTREEEKNYLLGLVQKFNNN